MAKRKPASPEPPPEAAEGPKGERTSLYMPADVLESARDAAWWCRISLSELAASALRAEIQRLQDDRNKGKPFPPREGKLPTGPRG